MTTRFALAQPLRALGLAGVVIVPYLLIVSVL